MTVEIPNDETLADEIEENVLALMEQIRESSTAKREAYKHIHSCEICMMFAHYEVQNNALFGCGMMSLYPRHSIKGMDEYWEEHKEHLETKGKFSHIPYKCFPLITIDEIEPNAN